MTDKNYRMLILLTWTCFFLLGCNENSISGSESFDYSIDQKLSCFCPFGNKTVRLYVQADTITDVIDISSEVHLPRNEWNRYRTIRGLFEEISSLDTSNYIVKVSYDPIYRYPAYIRVDPKPIYMNDTTV